MSRLGPAPLHHSEWRKAVGAHTDYAAAPLTSAVFIIMADTQQEINRVVVDLIKVISLRPCCCLMRPAFFYLFIIISWTSSFLNAAQFVAKTFSDRFMSH